MKVIEVLYERVNMFIYNHYLCKPFVALMNHKINFTFTKASNYEWNLCFGNHRHNYDGSNLFLNLQLFNKKTMNLEKQTNFIIDKPSVKIIQFDIVPSGKGLGSEVIDSLKRTMKLKGYKRIILVSDTKKSTDFWKKNDFRFHPDTSYPNSMYFDL
jgi:hypothetical protein